MELVRTLFDRDELAGRFLTQELHDLYDGDLHFPAVAAGHPYVVGNFVSTLDGVVSFKIKGQSGGGPISGSDPGDRFIMGLLRASVDAVIVGSGTVHDVSPKHLWIPSFVNPELKTQYANFRVNHLHKAENPLVVIVSGSGRLDLQRAVFLTPTVTVLIVTTASGQKQLVAAGATSLASVKVRVLDKDGGNGVSAAKILQLLASEFGVTTLLHEGGPTLFGQFLQAGLVNELFLTLSPQIAGRVPKSARPAVVQGIEFLPNTAPWFELLSAKQKTEHLYLRYRRTGPHPSTT